MIKPKNHFDWLESTVKCEKCGWQGFGRDTAILEMFKEGAEYCCPNGCSQAIAFVPFPTQDEVINDPRASEIDRKMAVARKSRWQRFTHEKLKSVEQLPTIDSPPKALIWDTVDGPDGRFVVIRNGADEIWRELSWFENYPRFVEVAKILKDKYGSKLKDLVPTEASYLDLYGDNLRASRIVEDIREAMEIADSIEFVE